MSLEDKLQALLPALAGGLDGEPGGCGAGAEVVVATAGSAYPVISASHAQALAARWATPDWMCPVNSTSAGGDGGGTNGTASGPRGRPPQRALGRRTQRPPTPLIAADTPDCDPQTLVHDILGAQALQNARRRAQRLQPSAARKPSGQKAAPQDRFALALSLAPSPDLTQRLEPDTTSAASTAAAAPAAQSHRTGAPRP